MRDAVDRELPALKFLTGGGAMGTLIRAYDWTSTPLGAISAWPQPLRTALAICLHARFPTAIYWGPELRLLYNDAWALVQAERHPGALGRRARDVWADIWQVVEPQFARMLATGEGFSTANQMLPMKRGGVVQETSWNDSFTPIHDEAGAVVGVFSQGHEVTERMLATDVADAAEVDAARALRVERSLLKAVIGQAPVGVSIAAAPDGRTLALNDKAVEIAGHRELGEDSTRSLFSGARHPDGRPYAVDEYPTMRALKRGEVIEAEEILYCRGGPCRRLAFSSAPVRDEDGDIVAVVTIITDVEEQRQAVAELRRSEESYRTLFDSLDAGFCVVEVKFDRGGKAVDYRFVEVNPAFEAQTGLNDATGRWMGELAPDHERHWFDIYGHVALTGQPARFENAAAALGDRWYDVHAFRIGEPEARRVAILFNDISERRRAEAALRDLNATLEERVAERTGALLESERRFRAIFDSAFQFMALLARDGTVIEVNQTAMAWSNITPEEIVGKPFWLAAPMRDNPVLEARVREEIGRAAKGELIRSEHEMRGSGEIRAIVDFSVKPVIGKDGHVTHVIAEGRDITELKRTQEQLRQAQKMEAIGGLTGGIAHDFNNLLMVVLANLELLKKRLPAADASTTRLVDGAMQGVQRGAALTERLLAFARRQDLKPEPVSVPALVLGMADLLKRSLGPQVRVETRFAPGVPKAMADANQLEMAILNLAVNARDAMPEGGVLTIAVEEDRIEDHASLPQGSYVHLSVIDTGTGMDAATLGRAMEPFFTTKGIGKGTGLGLSMIHGMAEQLGGRFTLRSAPDRGTTAEILLPVAEAVAAEPAHSPSPAGARQRAPSRLSVLVVDDDALVLMGTAAMIEDLGHEVIEAASGPDALAIVRSGRAIDVVVTDQAMPGMTGLQLAAAVKADRRDLPIVLATGYAELTESCEGLVAQRLGKPFRQDELGAVLAAATDAGAPGWIAPLRPRQG
jgi:PAS domain S-box-containing protein